MKNLDFTQSDYHFHYLVMIFVPKIMIYLVPFIDDVILAGQKKLKIHF